MEELYRMIEDKIYAAGYEGQVSGEEIYDEICDEIEDKEIEKFFKYLKVASEAVKEKGILCGVAINPATPIAAIECVLEKVDMVLVMTVNPGFGGQKLIPYTIEKVRELKHIIDKRGFKTDIEVDGGVNLSNVGTLLDAGANIIVAGSAVFHGDMEENIECFLEQMKES